jgi:hypothetical protein
MFVDIIGASTKQTNYTLGTIASVATVLSEYQLPVILTLPPSHVLQLREALPRRRDQ